MHSRGATTTVLQPSERATGLTHDSPSSVDAAADDSSHVQEWERLAVLEQENEALYALTHTITGIVRRVSSHGEVWFDIACRTTSVLMLHMQ
jgi:hypothetical protein